MIFFLVDKSLIATLPNLYQDHPASSTSSISRFEEITRSLVNKKSTILLRSFPEERRRSEEGKSWRVCARDHNAEERRERREREREEGKKIEEQTHIFPGSQRGPRGLV